MLARPAHAQFGFGRIVYDPTNYAQNVLTAARTLEQINNQITSLQNEAQMLINQARNLASLPYSSLQQLQQNVQRTQQLLARRRTSPSTSSRSTRRSSSNTATSRCRRRTQLVADARSRWQNTVGGLQDAMRVQAGVVGNIDSNRAADVGAGRPEPGRDRRAAGDAGRQPASRAAVAAASDLTAVVSANGRAER
jgi:P-type conjugative transfer protein TrbJ